MSKEYKTCVKDIRTQDKSEFEKEKFIGYMDHHMQNPPLHWGYSGTPPHNTWVPPQTRGVKRSISESDCEDAYSETSSKDQ